jgi:hypothetical protein
MASQSKAPVHAPSLADLGYSFNVDDQLRSIDTQEPFAFVNQAHYEALGDALLIELQEKLVGDEADMVKLDLPLERPVEGMATNMDENVERRSYIYHSKDFFTNTEKCMVLLQGTGAVRAGQWARNLCINDSLNTGSVLPFLAQAKKRGYSTIVLNPNQPFDGCWRAEDHGLYIWDHFLHKQCPAKVLHVVAHSYGGVTTVHLLRHRLSQAAPRIQKIAFTDAVHRIYNYNNNCREEKQAVHNFLAERAINWVASRDALNSVIDSSTANPSGCPLRSAGHNEHAYTTACAMPSILEFFDH